MSNEWLTTGQMLDKLQIGQVAEGSTYWEVKLVEPGHLVELNSGSNVVMSRDFLLEKWRILPNYVSFEEAMKALGEGKEIYFHGGNTTLDEPLKYPGGILRNMNGTKFTNYSLYTLFHGKWTVADTP